jgi:holin-like protein
MLGFSIILASLLMGQCLAFAFGLPIPGSIYGLIVLLVWLSIDDSQLAQVKSVGDFLLRHMALFIIPPGVAILDSFSAIKHEAWILLAGLFYSTVISFVVCVQIARMAQITFRVWAK